MNGRNLTQKDFRNRMKEKRSGEKSKFGFTSLTRFQESWENTIINQVFKK